MSPTHQPTTWGAAARAVDTEPMAASPVSASSACIRVAIALVRVASRAAAGCMRPRAHGPREPILKLYLQFLLFFKKKR